MNYDLGTSDVFLINGDKSFDILSKQFKVNDPNEIRQIATKENSIKDLIEILSNLNLNYLIINGVGNRGGNKTFISIHISGNKVFSMNSDTNDEQIGIIIDALNDSLTQELLSKEKFRTNYYSDYPVNDKNI